MDCASRQILTVVATMVLWSDALAQVRATDKEQQAIELAVAENLSEKKRPLPGFALDPRLYVTGLAQIGGREPPGLVPDGVEPFSEMPASHSRDHLELIAKRLGVAVLDDAGLCVSDRPNARCRVGEHSGVLAYTSAWVRGDAAQVMVHQWWASSGRSALALAVELFTLVRTAANGWRVSGSVRLIT